MEGSCKDGVIHFDGTLTEDADWQRIESYMETHSHEALKDGLVRLDMSKVSRANSCGLLEWTKLVQKLEIEVEFVNCPIWLITQINCSIEDFLMERSLVTSLIAPFYNVQKDEHVMVNLKIPADVPIKDDYEDFTLELSTDDGYALEPDFEADEYFYFLTEIGDRYLDKCA